MNLDKLTKLKERYMSMNNLSFNERIKKSKPIERWIKDTMNEHGVPWNGHIIKQWEACSTKDDKSFKRDAQAVYNSETVYSQIKFRQPNSGSDIGAAIIQPYPGSRSLVDEYAKCGKLNDILARDYQFDGIVYAVLDNSWSKLMLLPYKECVKHNYMKVLSEWWKDPSQPELNYYNRVFKSKEIEGAELRYKKDSGYGYDRNLEKIICYLPISIFSNDSRVTVVDMISPPDYLFN